MDEPAAPRAGPTTWLLLAAAAVTVGLVVGGFLIVLLREPAPAPSGPSGFDVAEVPKAAPASPAASALPAPAPSSLAMVTPGGSLAPPPGAATGGRAAAAPKTALEQAALSFTDAIRSSEKTLSDLARAYTAKYPSIRQYGKDWMSYPDLKKLNDDYMRDHDPIAFLRGLSASPSFPKLVSKYGGEPAIQHFLQDCFTKAPSGAVGASMDYINKDKTLDAFVQNVAGQAGLPPALLSVSDPSKLDVNKITESAVRAASAKLPPPDGKR